MNVLAVIPARGGSKSIPRKNLVNLAGKPLIAYSIEKALASRLITRTIVSTDDQEIADVAKRHGADVPFMRPAEFAQDQSPDVDVFGHALKWLRQHEKYNADVVVHLRPTMPLRKVERIDQAIQKLLENPSADSVRSVNIAAQTPFKMWFIGEGGYLDPVARLDGEKESYNLPRQKLPPVYWQNGYIDVVRPRVILETGSMTGTKILAFVITEPCIDIDYEHSLRQVERVLTGNADDAELSGSAEYPS